MNFDGAIFLDVGAHVGQTLAEVTRYKYQFRTIYAFEPMPVQSSHLHMAYRGFPNVQVLDYGLGDSTRAATLYGANDQCESSIYADKRDVTRAMQTECAIVDASNWFRRNLTPDDTVIMKINAEGSEIPILNSLIDSGEIEKVANVMIDFDIRKVSGLEHCEQALIQRFADIEFTRYSISEVVMRGYTHQDRIANWLGTL